MSILADYLDETTAAQELRKSERTLRAWRHLRKGPAWTTIGREVFYRRAALSEWLMSQEEQPVRNRRSRAA